MDSMWALSNHPTPHRHPIPYLLPSILLSTLCRSPFLALFYRKQHHPLAHSSYNSPGYLTIFKMCIFISFKTIYYFLFEMLGEDLTKAMTELLLNLLDENIDWREEAAKAMEIVLKEAGGYPEQIRQLMQVRKIATRTK